jgi:hypothetical protein
MRRIGDADHFLAKQILDWGRNGRLGSNQITHSKLQGFAAVAAESCRQRHPLSFRELLCRGLFELFRANGFSLNERNERRIRTDRSAGRTVATREA